MPKLTTYLSEDQYLLVLREMDEIKTNTVSKAIQSLIKKGSPYEINRTLEFVPKNP